MFKTLTPIIGIIVAVGLFFTYIQPTFQDVKGIQDESASYAEATQKASELQQRISELKAQQSSISLANLERLQALLPDRINEVSVLIDLDTLATMHHLKLGTIKVGDQTSTKTGAQTRQPPLAAAPAGAATSPGGVPSPLGVSPQTGVTTGAVQGQYATLDIGFSVSGTYKDFRMFLTDIERSLVLMEVTKITFAKSEGDTVPFMMSVRLYSLNPPTASNAATP